MSKCVKTDKPNGLILNNWNTFSNFKECPIFTEFDWPLTKIINMTIIKMSAFNSRINEDVKGKVYRQRSLIHGKRFFWMVSDFLCRVQISLGPIFYKILAPKILDYGVEHIISCFVMPNLPIFEYNTLQFILTKTNNLKNFVKGFKL